MSGVTLDYTTRELSLDLSRSERESTSAELS